MAGIAVTRGLILPPWYDALYRRVDLSHGVREYMRARGMLVVPPTMGGVIQTNLTASARNGTTVTASATIHTKGSWSSLIDPTSQPSYGIWVRGRGVAASATATGLLLDIGYGPTGGGNEEILLPDLDMGYASGATGAKYFYFPCYIPTGTRVSGRCQALIASDTVSVAIWLQQDPLYAFYGGKVDAYGVDGSNSRGTSVTPGNGSFGSWTQITSSTNRAHRFWAMGYDALADTTIVNAEIVAQLGTGPDSSNVTVILETGFVQGGAEELDGPSVLLGYSPVPSGKIIFARLASAEAEARGVIAYGMD